MAKPDPVLLLVCPTCGRSQKPNAMGNYPDGRDYCLRGPDNRGGSCFKNRPRDRGNSIIDPREALARLEAEKADIEACIEIVRHEIASR